MSCRIDCGWAAVVEFSVLRVGFTFGEWMGMGALLFEAPGRRVGI